MANELTIRAGDDYDILITVTENNEPKNIAGYEFYFTLKKSPAKADSDAIVAIDWTSHIDANNGRTMLILPRSITVNVAPGRYNYDIQYRTIDDKVRTIITGDCVVLTQTTRRI